MVIVGGDRGDLSVRHRDPRVERGEFQMLLVLLWTIVTARQRKDERIIALEFAELPQLPRLIGQFIVGKNSAKNNIRTHKCSPSVSLKDPERHQHLVVNSRSARSRERVSP